MLLVKTVVALNEELCGLSDVRAWTRHLLTYDVVI